MESFAGIVVFCGILNEMAATCKGICEMFKSEDVSMKLKYQEGQKRCTFCGIFLKFSGIRCPCCRTILRTKSRAKYSELKEFTNKS